MLDLVKDKALATFMHAWKAAGPLKEQNLLEALFGVTTLRDNRREVEGWLCLQVHATPTRFRHEKNVFSSSSLRADVHGKQLMEKFQR
ncbi:unnamed protein product [Heligmosomoides polygyrus]|uniref:Transcriptional regulator n=1 Tax=Heligmosomoides polygyrus TaxID=6339 RepID=A0A183FP84_HELPZ|nr:unnamed protein product [Heligmosomoides polygyrus]